MKNPRGSKTAAYRVIRGGVWIDDADLCRSAYRDRNHPGDRGDDLGFRLARKIKS